MLALLLFVSAELTACRLARPLTALTARPGVPPMDPLARLAPANGPARPTCTPPTAPSLPPQRPTDSPVPPDRRPIRRPHPPGRCPTRAHRSVLLCPTSIVPSPPKPLDGRRCPPSSAALMLPDGLHRAVSLSCSPYVTGCHSDEPVSPPAGC
jgi:hypothetical protein